MSSESRIWEICLFGSMRGGREMVIGPWPFNPSSPAYSTTEIFPRCQVGINGVYTVRLRWGLGLGPGQRHTKWLGNQPYSHGPFQS